MFRYKWIIFLLPLFWMQGAMSMIRVDAFSWSIGPNGIVINNSSATVTYPGALCFGASACGISLGMQITDNNIGSIKFIILGQGSPSAFGSEQAVAFINGLSGKTISGTAGLAKPGITVNACLFQYQKTSSSESHDRLPGVCSGGYVPPVPVPGSCDLSLNNSVMDFGDISSAALYSAGAGGKPSGVTVQQRTLNISCTPATTGLAYLRMTTDSASGNMLVSSNKDVGFLCSAGANDPAGQPLTPNALSGGYELTLDSTGQASIPIKAIPVNVTGNKPVAGTFSSHALLNISWN